MSLFSGLSLIIILIILIGVSLGRYPLLRMNRATIAFVGAAILVAIQAIPIEQAYQAIDLNTMVLLFSIMILNANFRLSGFFYLVSRAILKFARTPKRLLGILILFSGVLSALFLNDTVVLVFTPIVLEITRILKRRPIPYLIALAAAANVGSAATIIGNPQNILIGTFSKISFIEFLRYLSPIALVGLSVIWFVINRLYRKEFFRVEFSSISLPEFRIYRPLLRKSVIAACLMFGALMLGVSVPVAAMGAASLLLITRRLKSERVFAEIDWSLLVFFAGLFVVTKTIETVGWGEQLVRLLKINSGNEIVDLTVVSTISSNLISNVPAVLLLKNIIPGLANPKIGWLTMAMATTFAGNLTLLGSVANLIVAESARRHRIFLSFGEYLKSGILITLLTLLLGAFWLSLFL